MATKREHLLSVVKDLRRYLQWQGVEGDPGVIPASDEEREEARQRWKERREQKTRAMEAELKSEDTSVSTPEAPEQQTPDEPSEAADDDSDRPMAKSDDDAPWKRFKSKRKKTQNQTQASTSESGAESTDEMTNADKLDYLRNYMGDCKRCPLHKGRTNLVFGEGNAEARLVFVGEAPGYHEDQQGRPFVGKAGKLLNQMIGAMGLERDDTYICNVLKSRPPDNRDPRPEEVRECFPFLKKQLQIIEPEVIVTLGRPASQTLLESEKPLGALRGNWHTWGKSDVMPTYHPAYLLRNPEMKKKTWADLQQVMERLGLSR
jgi:DNA polymerase